MQDTFYEKLHWILLHVLIAVSLGAVPVIQALLVYQAFKR